MPRVPKSTATFNSYQFLVKMVQNPNSNDLSCTHNLVISYLSCTHNLVISYLYSVLDDISSELGSKSERVGTINNDLIVKLLLQSRQKNLKLWQPCCRDHQESDCLASFSLLLAKL